MPERINIKDLTIEDLERIRKGELARVAREQTQPQQPYGQEPEALKKRKPKEQHSGQARPGGQ